MPVFLDRIGEIAKRLTPAIGQEALERVAAELVYAVILENDRPEFQLLGGTRLWFDRFFAAASVGNFNTALWRAGPGTISVITHIIVDGTGTGALLTNCGVFASVIGGNYAANQVGNPRDARAKGGGLSTNRLTRQGGQQLASGNPLVLSPGVVYPVSFILSTLGFGVTGDAQHKELILETQAVNTVIGVNVIGYERPADAHEIDATVV